MANQNKKSEVNTGEIGSQAVALAEQVRTRWPQTAVIMASSAQDMETVMRMRKQGAVDYVTKPFGREMLRQALQRASERMGT